MLIFRVSTTNIYWRINSGVKGTLNKYFDLALAITGVCSLGLATVPISENQTRLDSQDNVTNISLLQVDPSFFLHKNQQVINHKTIETSNQLKFTAAKHYSIFNKEAENLPVSTITLKLVKEFEGFSDQAYLDTDGTPVIGYGLSRINGQPVRLGDSISEQQADAALKAELQKIQQQINSTVNQDLTEGQLSAIASLSFNVGFEPIKTSTLIRKLNAGDYTGAANEFLRWDKANVRGRLVQLPGLSRRRQAERQLFLQ